MQPVCEKGLLHAVTVKLNKDNNLSCKYTTYTQLPLLHFSYSVFAFVRAQSGDTS